MTKVTLNDVGSLIEATTAKNTINNNSDTIETAFDNTLSRDGTSPNQMEADFDMNSFRVLNLPAPVGALEPLRYQDLSDFVGGGTVTNIPPGGNTNDVLAKASNTNYDIHWSSAASEVSAGTNIAVTGASPATVSTIPNPNFATSVTTPSLVLNGTTLNSKTGTGAIVLATSPTLVTPVLGTPASGVATNLTGTAAGLTAGNVTTNANLTGDVMSVGNTTTLTNAPVIAKVLTGYTSGAGTVSATDSILAAIQKLNGNDATNANLTGVITSVGNATSIASQTGTGTKFVVDTSPSLVTPNLGTPSAVVLTNATGTAASLTAGNVTTNANLTGAITSVGNATSLGSFTSANLATAVTNETGSGALVFATSPALVTPTGIVKGDVGLGNVDNTSDATKNAASVTLTNKTLTSPVINTPTGIAKADVGLGNVDNTSDATKNSAVATLTNKTLDSSGTGNVLKISGVTVSRGQIPGTSTNDSATAGNFGEYISSEVLVGSAVSLTSGVAANITSVSLTAGDWLVWGMGTIAAAAATTSTYAVVWTSQTSVTTPTAPNKGGITTINGSPSGNFTFNVPVAAQRMSLSGTTTVYLGANVGFSVSTCTAYGMLSALRIR
jgi:hypothetical protein